MEIPLTRNAAALAGKTLVVLLVASAAVPVLLGSLTALSAGTATDTDPLPSLPRPKPLSFKQVNVTTTNTHAHQGYATDGTWHFTFDTQRINVWDAAWRHLHANVEPFRGLVGLNHLGDGDHYAGRLYLPAEDFHGCGRFANQTLLVYDAHSLRRLGAVDVSAQGHEVSSVTVVPHAKGIGGTLYVTSYCDGSRLWKYDLETLAFVGTLDLDRTLTRLQGVAYRDGAFYLANHTGILYLADLEGHVEKLVETGYAGAHEGLDYNGEELRWLIDLGSDHRFIYSFVPDAMQAARIAAVAESEEPRFADRIAFSA